MLGILSAPLVHGSLDHIFTILILVGFLYYGYDNGLNKTSFFIK
jgi:hypothetical protein